jgi:hypothetical protein
VYIGTEQRRVKNRKSARRGEGTERERERESKDEERDGGTG